MSRTHAANGISKATECHARAGEAFTRMSVTVILALIATLTFAFSFGNIWSLGLRLGVSPWVAPLVGPAVDLSVVGLLVAIRYLSLLGVEARRLRQARCLLVFSGLATLTLNVAGPIAHGAYGRAAFDAVGPLLLIGWAEVGPGLLRQIHAVRTPPSVAESDRPMPAQSSESVEPVRTDLDPVNPDPTESTVAPSVPRRSQARTRGRSNGRSEEELRAQARQFDRRHRARFGRPVSADALRNELRIGSTRARRLVSVVRAEARSDDHQVTESAQLASRADSSWSRVNVEGVS